MSAGVASPQIGREALADWMLKEGFQEVAGALEILAELTGLPEYRAASRAIHRSAARACGGRPPADEKGDASAVSEVLAILDAGRTTKLSEAIGWVVQRRWPYDRDAASVRKFKWRIRKAVKRALEK